jgi:hypothetical protein
MQSRPRYIGRKIDPKYLKRASQVEDGQVGPYLESIVQEMYRTLDGWRFGKLPSNDFKLALDACIALYTEAELRGLA